MNDHLHSNHHDEDMLPPAEAEMADALRDVAARIEPDAAFVARLAARFAQSQSAPLDRSQEEERVSMYTQNAANPPYSPASYRLGALTLAAALLVIVFGGALLFLAGRPSEQALAPAMQETPLPQMALGGWVSDYSPETLDQMRAMGMTWVAARLDFSPPSAHLDTAQILITNAHAHGFKIMLQVVGNPQDIMANRDGYNARLATVLRTIAGFNPDAIQVWTEPNIDRNWLRGEITPTAYVTLLRQAYLGIKTANPDVMVISAAPAPTTAQSSFPDQIMNDDRYYQGLVSAGMAEVVDCIGVQYVEGVVPPDQTSGDPRGNEGTRYLPTMIERAAAPFADSGLPLCFTSLGYSSYEGVENADFTSFPVGRDTSAQEQAEWLAGALEQLAQSSTPRVEMALVWRINPYGMTTSGDEGLIINNLFALIRPDGSCTACTLLSAP